MRNRVVDFWSDLNLFNPDQFAHLRDKSTLLQLLACYDDWAKAKLEYAAPVWSPDLIKDIVALEKVQRRASRLALRQKRGEMSYE